MISQLQLLRSLLYEDLRDSPLLEQYVAQQEDNSGLKKIDFYKDFLSGDVQGEYIEDGLQQEPVVSSLLAVAAAAGVYDVVHVRYYCRKRTKICICLRAHTYI